jgi:hypothetical protein
MPDGLLIRMRDTYPIETAWAPPWTGDELRHARTGARDARLAAIRATAEAAAARQRNEHEQADQQQALAVSYQSLHDSYRERETAFATAMADRADWELATRHQRHLAVAADAELRRRHPAEPWPPLRSAEPEPATRDEHGDPAPGEGTEETGRSITDLAALHREFTVRLAERESLMLPAEDPDMEAAGPAFPAWSGSHRDAILQPPQPQIQPSERLLGWTAIREPDREAAD